MRSAATSTSRCGCSSRRGCCWPWITVIAASLIARVTGVDAARGLPLLILATVLFVLICEHIVPLIIVRRDPERVLELLLPSFEAVARISSR